jgi:hypothetical protein
MYINPLQYLVDEWACWGAFRWNTNQPDRPLPGVKYRFPRRLKQASEVECYKAAGSEKFPG